MEKSKNKGTMLGNNFFGGGLNMKNILMATDLTINSDRALERAIMLAKSTGAKLHIVHVAPVYHLSGRKSRAETLKQDKEALIRAYLSGYSGAETVKTTIHAIDSENAFAEIIKTSQECKADLIVMGVHNKVGFMDMFVGTTIERVIRKGLKPVLMVVDKPKDDYKSVVVGCDFSDAAKNAFNFALRLSSIPTISLVHSYDYPDTSTGKKIQVYAGETLRKLETEKLQKFAKERGKALKKYNIPADNFSHKNIQGSPRAVLAAEVKKSKAGLLAIGVHSRSSFLSSKLGGVAQAILASPPCDVLVAKEI